MSLQAVASGSTVRWPAYSGVQTARPEDKAPAIRTEQAAQTVPARQTAGTSAPAAAQGANSAAEAMGALNTMSAAARSSVRGGGNLADLYRLDNQYYYGTSSTTWARLDANQDGGWDRDELSAYADAYRKATGRTLDVDGLIAQYADADGVIRYDGQTRMYNDDALGIAYAKDRLILAEYRNDTSSQTARIDQKALDRFVKDHTYGSPGKLYAAIDKDEDGVWSLEELTNFASAYEQATGIKLDVETLFAKYDRDGSGSINYYEQNEMYRDDALGLSRISDALKAAETKEDPIRDNSLSDSMRDAMKTWDRATAGKLATAFSQSIQKAAMLDAFMMTNNLVNNRNRFGYGNGYGMGMYSAWNYYNIGILSMFR